MTVISISIIVLLVLVVAFLWRRHRQQDVDDIDDNDIDDKGDHMLKTWNTTDPVGATSTNVAPNNSFCGIRLTPRGRWQTTNVNAKSASFSSPQFSGSWRPAELSGDVWVLAERMFLTAGANLASNSGFNTRLRLNATRSWVVDTTKLGAGVPGTMAIKFKFYDAAVGGNLLKVTQPRAYTAIKTR